MTRNVVTSLADAVAMLPGGATIALGAGASSGTPCAFAIEILRQKRCGFHAISLAFTPAIAVLIAGRALASVTVPMTTADRDGAALVATAREGGKVVLHDRSLPSLVAGVRAAALGIDALPANGAEGHMPAIRSDVTVLHAHAADSSGNVLLRAGRRFPVDMDLELASGAQELIVCVEQIVSTRTTQAESLDLVLDADRVDHVVEVPFGAWPDACVGRYAADPEGLRQMTATQAGVGVLDPLAGMDHAAMLQALGSRRLWGGAAHVVISSV